MLALSTLNTTQDKVEAHPVQDLLLSKNDCQVVYIHFEV